MSKYVLRLYVVGGTRQSTKAMTNLKAICETFLKGSYDLTVIDLVEHPECAQNDQVIVVPTLIRLLPLPVYRIIGDLSQTERVLSALDLPDAPFLQ